MRQHAVVVLCFLSSISVASAQDTPPRCDDLGDLEAAVAPSEYLDASGYPIQGAIPVEEILVATTDPCLTVYTFEVDDQVWVVPDARLTTTGTWRRLDRRRGISTEAEEMSVSQGVSFSESIAHEVSVGISTGAEIEVAPFGLGVTATVEASLGYALTLAKERSKGIDRSITVTVNPGEVVEIWERVAKVNVEWSPSAYKIDPALNQFDPMALSQKWVTEVYLPTFTQRMINSGLSKKVAKIMTEPEKLIWSAPWPATDPADVLTVTRALTPYNNFMASIDEEGLKASYGLPFNETATVRYKF